ncbi:hypothetical protein AKO1_006429 [Acrasis kona]|uniref:Ankyrin repeat-containing protein n=1 Tax=Acrasis kona TaxID=1008807 RepID=A0AAW2YJ29_9EUKA
MHPKRHIPLVNSPTNQHAFRFSSPGTPERTLSTIAKPIPTKSKLVESCTQTIETVQKETFSPQAVRETLSILVGEVPKAPKEFSIVANLKKTFNVFTIVQIMFTGAAAIYLSTHNIDTYGQIAISTCTVFLLCLNTTSQILRSYATMMLLAAANAIALIAVGCAVMIKGDATDIGSLPTGLVLMLLSLCYSVIYSIRYYLEQTEEVHEKTVSSPYVVIVSDDVTQS